MSKQHTNKPAANIVAEAATEPVVIKTEPTMADVMAALAAAEARAKAAEERALEMAERLASAGQKRASGKPYTVSGPTEQLSKNGDVMYINLPATVAIDTASGAVTALYLKNGTRTQDFAFTPEQRAAFQAYFRSCIGGTMAEKREALVAECNWYVPKDKKAAKAEKPTTALTL